MGLSQYRPAVGKCQGDARNVGHCVKKTHSSQRSVSQRWEETLLLKPCARAKRPLQSAGKCSQTLPLRPTPFQPLQLGAPLFTWDSAAEAAVPCSVSRYNGLFITAILNQVISSYTEHCGNAVSHFWYRTNPASNVLCFYDQTTAQRQPTIWPSLIGGNGGIYWTRWLHTKTWPDATVELYQTMCTQLRWT